jgi:DNA-binding HxlR family transcriptional regulator
MHSKQVLSDELRILVESRINNTLEGIENTLQHIFEQQEMSLQDVKETIQSLESNFNLLSQKWNLQILYILFLRKTLGFGDLKRTLGVNSRTLSDKLKSLKQYTFINRSVKQEPPIRVRYSLTKRGENTILLALPLIYYFIGKSRSEE